MNRVNYIIEQLRGDTQADEKLVQVYTPLGLWLGAFNCSIKTLPQLTMINKSSEGNVYFRWNGIKKEQAL